MSHYSFAQDRVRLRDAAKLIARQLSKAGVTNPVLVYRGMSGVACATALSLAIRKPPAMVYVRKPHEKSHGEALEYSPDALEGCTPVFVDDFVATGATLRACIQATKDCPSLRLNWEEAWVAEIGGWWFETRFRHIRGVDEAHHRPY